MTKIKDFSARLKSCPDTNHSQNQFFRNLFQARIKINQLAERFNA